MAAVKTFVGEKVDFYIRLRNRVGRGQLRQINTVTFLFNMLTKQDACTSVIFFVSQPGQMLNFFSSWNGTENHQAGKKDKGPLLRSNCDWQCSQTLGLFHQFEIRITYSR